MNSESASVIELLTYIEEVEKLKRKPVYVVPTDFFVAHQSDLELLPEVTANTVETEREVWLRVPRMQETPAPTIPAALVPWVTSTKSLDKLPVLNSSRGPLEGEPKGTNISIEQHPEVVALFDWYLEYQWAPWVAAEKPRRKSISLYNKLFQLYQVLSSDGAENPVELVWGLGMASWKPAGSANKVEHPLLTQSCDLRLNEKTFALEIYPRQAEAKIELDCYSEMELAGVLPLESMWKEALSKQATNVNPFEHSTYEGFLKAAVAQLDSTGRYEERMDGQPLPTPGENLLVTSSWVVFARKRSADVFLEDVRRFKAKLADGAEVPPVIKEFVKEGDSQVRVQPEVAFRGLSTSASGNGVRDLFFPLPYNEEQVSIASKLENNSGVIVQGPPGTGKTHTIANIICHYLAQGKRVLVTSKGDTALSVLQEKLPERIRALSVSLLSDEQDGMRQFEHSIARIAAEVASLQPSQLQANIGQLESSLNELHARIASLDQDISREAALNMQTYPFQGRDVAPEELAKLVMDQMDDHQWFVDQLPSSGAEALPFTEAEAQQLRAARSACKGDLGYVEIALPELTALPGWDVLLGLHRDIVRAKEIDEDVESGDVFALKDSSFETFEAARALLSKASAYLESLKELNSSVLGSGLLRKLRELKAEDVLVTNLAELTEKFKKLEAFRKQLVAQAVDIPDGVEKHQDFLDALHRLEEGKSPFALPFGKGEARKLIGEVTVAGTKPSGVEQWKLVKSALKWRVAASQELARLASLGGEFGLEPVSRTELFAGVREGVSQLEVVERVHQLVYGIERGLYADVERVFGTRVAAEVPESPETGLNPVVASLHAHLDKGRLGYAMARVTEYVNALEVGQGPLQLCAKEFLQERLGNSDAEEPALRTSWLEIQDELKRLTKLKPQLELIGQMAEAATKAGAPLWGAKLLTEPPTEDFDPVLPANWADAWAWRIAYSVLTKLDVHSKLRLRFEERRELTRLLSKTYQDLVAERTWLGVYNNSPPSIRQALQGYLTSIQAMGSGTGIRALRHRRNAREAMVKAYQAVPCWILPQWRVSETLPAEMGLFDLVIIDEASQSDIWALPALLRGRQLLVVGDHKQVSPSVVGMPEQKIVDIQRRFLDAQPHGRHMTPDMSIYDLARVVFAGNSVMLKEHFRCVSPIIEYSNREFYDNEIQALRVPKSTERLDPPLIDVTVKGGYRQGDRNPVEAKAIVDEIQAILEDDAYAGRTIGVVTLVGTDQAKLIHELIAESISPEAVIARKITVGPPPMFQGRERDIMMVSMVLQRGDRAAANSLGQQQRFNVALSRARDRTYLFRSVEDSDFPADSLTGRLMQHFRRPFVQDQRGVSASRELCESGFEREMFDALTSRGYRVRPQVPCGGYRIDFVVEGAEGRRLAVECDGDRFHGPGQWGADMARQRVLERAGWVFWRCFASSFVRRRQEVLADLVQTLTGLGIEPLGDAPYDDSVWVSNKTVDPLKVTEASSPVEESI
ncbi:AAA family ATPase [Nostoc sp. CHAB 5834]|nr:AAA family ATPase [Nostoc sp. CHAB 5834]